MATSDADTAPRFECPWIGWIPFLLLVLAVRLVHLVLLGIGAVPGNNVRTALQAKAITLYGFSGSFLDTPPGSATLLAGMTQLLNDSSGRAMLPLLLLAHLLLAIAFWLWLKAQELPIALDTTSLLLFAFLPALNSYEGFDNLPVVFAAAAFLLSLFAFAELRRADWLGGRFLTVLVLSSFSLLLFRGEYLVYLPLCLALWLILERLFRRSASFGRDMLLVTITLGALLAGGAATMSVRQLSGSDFGLGAPDYVCVTFLDGLPEQWLTPAQENSFALRVQRGIELFGHPADYDYSLPRLVQANPEKTFWKFALNLPRWLYHLGRRHVVVPLPVAILALIGVLDLLIDVIRRREWANPLAMMLAVILMTAPLAALVLYADYLMPAFVAICVLAAAGLLAVVSLTLRVTVRQPTIEGAQMAWLLAVFATCATMEGLLWRAGGTLPDSESREVVAQWIDTQLGDEVPPPVLLDPYSGEVDALSKADIRNRWLRHTSLKAELGSLLPAKAGWGEQPSAYELSRKPAAQRLGVRYVVVWRDSSESPELLEKRLRPWHAAGYEQLRSTSLENEAGREYEVHLLHRTP